jgi:hypothetical protein
MRGHEPIEKMRRQGATPLVVFVDTYPGAWGLWQCWSTTSPRYAQVEIEESDLVAGLDLRYAVGLTVMVSGYDRIRTEAVGRAFEVAKAHRVIVTVFEATRHGPEVVHTTDTLEAVQ